MMLFNCGEVHSWCFCWRRLLRVPWTARRSNQSILREISPRCSLEGLMLKLKLQYFDHLMRRADSFEKILMLGKIEGRRRRGDRGWDCWMASSTQWTWVCVKSGRWWWTGRPGMLQFMGSQRVRHDWVTEPNWTASFQKNKPNQTIHLFSILSSPESSLNLLIDKHGQEDPRVTRYGELDQAIGYPQIFVSCQRQYQISSTESSFRSFSSGPCDLAQISWHLDFSCFL